MAKGNSEYRMAIKIAGEIEKSLYTSTDMTRKELNKIAREAAKTSFATKASFSKGMREVEPLFNRMEDVAVRTFKAVATAAALAGTAVIGVGIGAAKVGIEFESAFAGVKKTTEATTEEYAAMREEIIAMTREIPAAGTEIAEVAEAAGQLGIKKENLIEFSKVMIDLGESTNLTATEGASQLAKFANITQMSADEYDRLGSTIVDLGNNFATTEADIVDMSMRLASSGELAGYSEAQILAIATAISSVGIEAEAGGSSMSKLIKNVQVAVETGSGDLKDYAKVANMTAEEFKAAFKEDAVEAVSGFITGLNDVERNGKSATVILDDMGLTEIRLSNTILSLANSGDLMSRSIETANTAWEENTALTNEAEQRYATMESKLGIMKNGFKEMGIEIYDQFNEPLREGIDVISDFTHSITDKITSSNIVREFANDVRYNAPTFIRQVKDMGKAAIEFTEPLINAGEWMVENPTIFMSTISGIGMAIVTYKVVDGIMGVATAVKALTAASAPILAITGTVAAITGITVAVKTAAMEAKKANLEEHFGDITLSMKELNGIAKNIIQGKTFEKLDEAVSAFGNLHGAEERIDEAVRSLNMANWKIEVGMELTEDEQEAYKSNIQRYIEEAQNYVVQQQYTVGISIGLMTDQQMEGSNLVTQINQFYGDKQIELQSLGKQLNLAITEAFADDLLEFDEVKHITEIQQKMSNIQSAIAGSNFEAEMGIVEGKYKGKELTSDSFLNLMTESQSEIDKQAEVYTEAYKNNYSANKAMFDEGYINEKQYEKNKDFYEASRIIQISDMQTKAMDFAAGSINDTYGEDLKNLDNLLGDALEYYDTSSNAVGAFNPSGIRNTIKESMGKPTMDAMDELWETMEDSFYKLVEQRDALTSIGVAAPEEMNKAINEAAKVGAAAGDDKAILLYMATQAESNKQYSDKLQEMSKEGVYVPEEIKSAIDNSVLNSYEYLRLQVEIMAEEGMDVDVKTRYNLKPSISGNTFNTAGMALRADGGIITQPEIAMLAEAGYPEVVVPINGSQNAISLWQQAGEMLGVFKRKKGISDYGAEIIDSTSSGLHSSEESNKFTFSPVYQFNGEAPSKKDLDDHVKQSFEDWETMMNRWMRNNQRFSFS